MRQGDPETAEQQELGQRHKAKCIPAPARHLPLGELLDLCVHLLIHCPISQSKLIYLLEFCAVLDLEFRHSLLGRHLTDQEPNELVNLHSQSACQKTSCPLKIDNFIL